MRTLFDDQPSRGERLAAGMRRHPWRWAAAIALLGLLLVALATRQALGQLRRYDDHFDARVERPAFARGSGPAVAFDAGHYEVHTATASYRPFAALLESDGFRVSEISGTITAERLVPTRVLVIANALGVRGALAMAGNLFRLRSALDWAGDAFRAGECAAIRQWVLAGGGLLLVADHKPAGAAVHALGAEFGVDVGNWYTEDATAANHDASSDVWTSLVFSRANGLLASHPITEGRGGAERVESVITFTGGSLGLSAGATALMRLGPRAEDYPAQLAPEGSGRSAAGRAQGVALQVGRGRVVVLGESGMLGAFTLRRGQDYSFGMNRRDHGNRQFAINIVRWLAGVI